MVEAGFPIGRFREAKCHRSARRILATALADLVPPRGKIRVSVVVEVELGLGERARHKLP